MRRLIVLSLISPLVFLFALSENVQGQIAVDTVIVNFKPDKRPVKNVTVMNSGDEPMYVVVEPTVISRAGFEDEKREPTKSLVASPKRFSIQANGERTVRLFLNDRPKDVEEVYRVRFLPQAKGIEEEIASVGDTKATLKIIFAVGILIFAEPSEPNASLRWERSKEQIIFYNDGNVNMYLDEGRQCLSAKISKKEGEESMDCSELPSKRLYPGNRWAVKVSDSKEVLYRKRFLGKFEALVIKKASI